MSSIVFKLVWTVAALASCWLAASNRLITAVDVELVGGHEMSISKSTSVWSLSTPDASVRMQAARLAVDRHIGRMPVRQALREIRRQALSTTVEGTPSPAVDYVSAGRAALYYDLTVQGPRRVTYVRTYYIVDPLGVLEVMVFAPEASRLKETERLVDSLKLRRLR